MLNLSSLVGSFFSGVYRRFPILLPIVICCFVLVGIDLAKGGLEDLSRISLLDANYTTTTGTIAQGTNIGSSSPFLFAKYDYVTDEGHLFHDSIYQAKSGVMFSLGEKVKIRYSNSNEKLSIPENAINAARLAGLYRAIIGLVGTSALVVALISWIIKHAEGAFKKNQHSISEHKTIGS